ncbi:MAG: ATP-binding cassette domain-containing protein [Prevotellaceae bacterium]|jgi:ABC-2 type transport system ATP-binding protein|nr:ATP-binding cassette domain-containing protein [Prevotellaceae bacterium]
MLLEARNITKQYNGHLALYRVNIHIAPNAVHGLLGPNGAGKTTLIRIINCITRPDSGEVLFKGKRLQPEDTRFIGYLPEERGLYKKMKVGEQILYLARLKGLSKVDAGKRIKYWLEKFEIDAWKNRTVEELSKGMQQKVQFITTVLHEPGLLIFDEPFSGFDPLNASLMKQEILELRQKGATVIFSTHDMFSVEELCDTISLINQSKVVLEGAVSEIKERHKQSVFIVKTKDFNASVPPNDLFEVISTKIVKGVNEMEVKVKADISVNELIREIMTYCPLLSFEEKLPGMDEIFIETVSKNSV